MLPAKYGEEEGGWVPSKVPRYQVSNIWGTILKVEEVSFSGGKVFSGRVGFKVANISQVRF